MAIQSCCLYYYSKGYKLEQGCILLQYPLQASFYYLKFYQLRRQFAASHTVMAAEHPVSGVLDVILKNCKRYPDKAALHWLNKDGEVEEMLTYMEIEERTLKTSKGLLDLLKLYNLEEGAAKHCVVLCYPPGLEFIMTFIACLRARLIAGECLLNDSDCQQYS